MLFAADDFAAWLVGVLADAGRKKLAELVLGTEQERALRQAASAAVQRAAAELCPGDEARAAHLAMVVGEVFGSLAPAAPLAGQATVLQALGARIGAQLAVLDDASLTGTGQSSASLLGVSSVVVSQALTGHLVREIVTLGAQGGPLFPLACQLQHDMTQLQGQRAEGMLRDVLAGLDRLGDVPDTVAAPTALAQLPARPEGFTGRDGELAALADLLNPHDREGPRVVAVAGLAGVGKTALAVAAGHAACGRGWFGGGVLFADLRGYDQSPAEPGQVLDALLRALGVPAGHIPPTAQERAGLYRSVLARAPAPVLVVADNAACEAQVVPLLPGSGGHKVLVTSRHTLAALDARLVEVTILGTAAAVGLLDVALRIARPGDGRIGEDQDAAGRVVKACGGLPLALKISAALLRGDRSLTVAELADDLSAESRRLERLAYGEGGSVPSVAAAFALSCNRLDAVTARVFRLLPVNPGPDISDPAAAVLAGLPADQARAALGALARAHLAEPAPGAARRWQMHDLVRLYARGLSDQHAAADGREDARSRLTDFYTYHAAAADEHLRALPGAAMPDAMPAWFTGREDALQWMDSERACLVPAVAMAAAAGGDRAALTLALSLATYLAWRRRFDEWAEVTTTGLGAAWRLGDKDGEARALTNLGSVLLELRRFDEAITACQAAAAICRGIGDQDGQAKALCNLGIALREVHRFDEAIAACQGAASLFRGRGDQRGLAGALTNLGAALGKVHRFEGTITACQDAVALCRDCGDQRGLAGALINLAAALTQVHRFDEAIAACQDAASYFRDSGDQHSQARALANLGHALHQARRLDEAIAAHQDAVRLYRDSGDQHSQARALNGLAAVLRELRRFDEATAACQDAATLLLHTSAPAGTAGAAKL